MKIIICGAYGIGTHLAKMLSRNHEDITLIDEDDERLAQIGSDFDLLTAQDGAVAKGNFRLRKS